jgi:signal transduction histidine kinase
LRARGQLVDSSRRVTVDVSDEVVVRGDQQLLARALGNIVDNAVTHGDGQITLSVRLAPERHVAFITAHDGGTMDPAFLAHAAERFRRDESSRTGTGAGLGLALADAIAIAHGGQLRICSAGSHHSRATPESALDAIPCGHPRAGTTISLLVAATRVRSDAPFLGAIRA